MKFGRNLHRYQVVEWSPFYIDYQALKQLHKVANCLALDTEEDVDLTGLPGTILLSSIPNMAVDFRASLEHNLLKARGFFKHEREHLRQRVNALFDHYGITASTDFNYASRLEVMDLRAAFLELRNSLKQLLWYWLVNFDKIIDSLAKFQKGLRASDADLAILTKSVEDLCQVNAWLEKIPSKKHDGSHEHSVTTLLHQQHPNKVLFHSLLANAFAAIEQDNALDLDRQLRRGLSIPGIDEHSRQHFLFALLHFSAVNGSQSCTERLLLDIGSLQDFRDVHIHWLVSKIGRSKQLHDRRTQAQILTGTAVPDITLTKTIDQLAHIVAKLGFKLENALQAQDGFGRTPLHYAVQYDLPQVCQNILKHMGGSIDSHPTAFPSPALIPDQEKLTSLDIAVLNGNATILSILLDDHRCRMITVRNEDEHFPPKALLPGDLLRNALALESFPIIRLLHRSFIDLTHTDHNGNTALHLAVRSGKKEYVTEILQGRETHHNLDLDAREVVYGWTPLTMASARGDYPIVELLLGAGADPTTRDHFGWRAKDYAAFRGWLPMAKELTRLTAEHSTDEDEIYPIHHQRRPVSKFGLAPNMTEDQTRQSSPSESQIYVSLGALDTYEPVAAIDLSSYVWPDPYNPQREADFYIEVRAINENQAKHVVQLPILEDMANKPWRFVTNNAKDFKLAFNIYYSNTSAHKGSPLIGSAVALLDSLKQGLGSARESLIRNFTIPILHKDTLDFIGTVTFYFLIVTPFPHPEPKQVIKQKLSFPSSNGPPVIGHRGASEAFCGRREPGN